MKPVLPVLAALLLSGSHAFAVDIAADIAAEPAALVVPPAAPVRMLAELSAAARAGDARAAYRTGLMVRNGKGTAPDSAAAVGWLEQAAHGGVPEAMFVLANMLVEGEGGATDPAAARAWLERAAALDHPAAWQQLAQMARDEGSTERADALLKEAAHALKHRAGP